MHLTDTLYIPQVYRAEGQIAETGFKNPSWTQAELAVFGNGGQCFGVFWHQLNSFSLFTRVVV